MSRSTLVDVVDRTTRCPVTIWGFGVGGMLTGLIRAGQWLGRDDLIDYVAGLMVPTLDAAPAPTDHLISVDALQALAAIRSGLDIDVACERWLTAVTRAHRHHPDEPPVHRQDLERWSSTIWVDCMHTDGPGLVAMGMHDAAVALLEESAAKLQRPDGLFQHGYDVSAGTGNGVAWGRGQAWALLGLTETLEAGDDEVLRRRLARLVEALARHEDGGQWHTVVDDPHSPIEHSVAAYVALAIPRGIASGSLRPDHEAIADRARAATMAELCGGELRVSAATPIGDAAHYRSSAAGVFPWGQAPVLHFLLDQIGATR